MIRSRGFALLMRSCDVLAGICLAGLVVQVLITVLSRNVLKLGPVWPDDLARYLQIWMICFAVVSLSGRGDHIAMDALYLAASPRLKRVLRVVHGIAVLTMAVMMVWLGWQQAALIWSAAERSRSGLFPAILGYASLPVGFLLAAGTSLHYLARQIKEAGDG